MTRLLYIDLFCGAGGTSTGVESARIDDEQFAKVIACVNHDANAIASHAANHPNAMHFTEDIRTLNLTPLVKHVESMRKLYPEARVVLWASLECTNFSIAKGGQSRDADSRTLAEHLYRYIEAINPEYIQIENVKEFMTWGPLIVKEMKDKRSGGMCCPLTIKSEGKGKARRKVFAPTWVPDPEHKGEYFRNWLQHIRSYGYKFDHRILDAADYGAYTSRKRFFGIFAMGDLPIAFPEPTHTKNQQNTLFDRKEKWKPVREVLDLEDEGSSIFDRKVPLVDATHERVYAGLVKFVAGGKEAFMIKYNSVNGQTGKHIPPSIDDPCPVVSTQGRLGVAKVCFLSKHFSGEPDSKNIGIDGPAHTITAVDHHSLVSSSFLSAYYGNGFNTSVERPAPTVTTADRFSLVRPIFLDMQYGNGSSMSVNEPAGTVTTNPKHQLVTCRPWVMNTHFSNIGSSLEVPCPTITANRKQHYLMNPQYTSKGGSIDKPCFTLIARMDKMPPYLMTADSKVDSMPSFIKQHGNVLVYEIYDTDSDIMVKIKEFMALYGIVDVKMRMLKIIELKQIMGFPADYVLIGTQTEQKKYIGNAVEVRMSRAMARATVVALNKYDNRQAA